ncbi:threonine/serine ThrE exporter family protein [Corynebacterium durum]|uniref:threonine/serine ThrE exporter family protein n=1 Tax=Corynebacterium durum TaxID=61592 RepID=UPI0028806908|nr:threonine/serine exporter family protein [Corynebacterium durum]
MAQESNSDDSTAGQQAMGVEADAVLRLGLLMVAAGTGGYRVIRAMKRAARAMGFDRLDAEISITSVVCTFHRGVSFRTVVATQPAPAVDASRIEALEHLTHHLPNRMSANALTMCLDDIVHSVTHRWSRPVLMVAAGAACAAFALLNYFPAEGAAAVAVAAACGQLVRMILASRHLNQLGVVAVAAATSCLVFYLLNWALPLTHLPDDARAFAAGYIAAVLYLIPGFPLFSSMLDLSRFDITAGLTRLCYAMAVITAATMSVALVSAMTGLSPLSIDAPTPTARWYLLAAVASFVGVGGFALLFNSSRRMVLFAASIGVVANMVRLVMIDAGVQPQYAAYTGGVVVGLLGAVITARTTLPRITMTVPASVIMIPGTAMYRAVHFLNSGDIDQALSNAATAGLIIVWISAGLVTARILTDRDWAFGKPIDFQKHTAD